jgi:hypothetical protein
MNQDNCPDKNNDINMNEDGNNFEDLPIHVNYQYLHYGIYHHHGNTVTSASGLLQVAKTLRPHFYDLQSLFLFLEPTRGRWLQLGFSSKTAQKDQE